MGTALRRSDPRLRRAGGGPAGSRTQPRSDVGRPAPPAGSLARALLPGFNNVETPEHTVPGRSELHLQFEYLLDIGPQEAALTKE